MVLFSARVLKQIQVPDQTSQEKSSMFKEVPVNLLVVPPDGTRGLAIGKPFWRNECRGRRGGNSAG